MDLNDIPTQTFEEKCESEESDEENTGEISVIGDFSGAQLDLALNRPNVVHAALLAGPASETFLARCRRLERFRTGDQHHQAGKAAPRNTGRRHERV